MKSITSYVLGMGKMSKKKILGNVNVSDLERLRQAEKDVKTRERLHAVILELKGYSREEIANILSATRASVWRWITRFNKDGIKGLRDKHKTGRHGKMETQEKKMLREELGKSPREAGYTFDSWSTKLVLHHLKEKYSVTYHPRYIQRFLGKLRIKLKIPRPRHYKSGNEEEKDQYIASVKEGFKKMMGII